jgi:hypothetical protein
MKILFDTIKRFISTKPNIPMYGRWRIDYEHSIQDRKVYLTNMDHCGCCGNIKEIISKIHNIEINNESNKSSTDDDLLPYFL